MGSLTFRVLLLTPLSLFTMAAVIRAADVAAENVEFGKSVFPILQRACIECHGSEKQEGDLRLDRRQDAFDSGMLVPGQPDESELLRRVMLPRNHEEVMPARGEPLSRRDILTLRNWIQQGAVWPEDWEAGRHWSYVAPARPSQPEVSDPAWPKTGVDPFLLRRLDEEGLRPSPPAAPETLVRRVFLDLIGLPPSPAEVQRFVADPSDVAYRRLVDDLLRRPQFGERWARPWLDLARYADSHGFQRDDLRDIWAYRDWVIQALNDDMPFDQFTIEQVAGDLLPDATESQKIASGFHRCAPTNVEAGSLPEETRVEQVIDRVNTTGAVWLGSTLECAQCHDHKYDPFTMVDYYGLLAYFNSTEPEAERTNPKVPSSIAFRGPTMPLSNPRNDAQRTELQDHLNRVQASRMQRRQQLDAELETWAKNLSSVTRDAPQTQVLRILDFESQGATDSFELLEDGSVLLVGDDPADNDVYTIRVRAESAGIRALRLDVLTYDSLPGKGPGRGDGQRSNFVLNEFTVTRGRSTPGDTDAAPGKADGVPTDKDAASDHADEPQGAEAGERLKFSSATADFSQQKWDVSGAIDGDPKTGWAIAPRFGQSHWAVFVLASPLDASAGEEWTVRLTQQFGSARTIGRLRLSSVTGNPLGDGIPAAVAECVAKPPETWNVAERQRLLDYRVEQDPQAIQLGRDETRLQREIEKLAADTTLVMVELDKPRPSAVFERGDYRRLGASVEPRTPAFLHQQPDGPANRLTLARWLADPANPLVARVTVNRWWAELFGQGLVPTVEDFGIKGDPPSHPELLDWLAVEFVENGWSMKHMLRQMVLSATYRQSSHSTAEMLERDDLNRLLARGPRMRMDAETIRDNALSIAGLLSLKQFGPPIRPYQPDGIWTKVGGKAYDYVVSPGEDQYRRGIYVVLKRGAPYPSFVNFDASARLACTVKRSRTNTPLQALTLLNDPVYVEAALAFARRIVTERPTSDLDSQLDYAFQLCTARRPTEFERDALRQLLEDQEQSQAEDPQGTDKLLGSIKPPPGVTRPRLAAWYAVATALLNLHETINKE